MRAARSPDRNQTTSHLGMRGCHEPPTRSSPSNSPPHPGQRMCQSEVSGTRGNSSEKRHRTQVSLPARQRIMRVFSAPNHPDHPSDNRHYALDGRTGVSSVFLIENGKVDPRISTVVKILSCLGASLAVLELGAVFIVCAP